MTIDSIRNQIINQLCLEHHQLEGLMNELQQQMDEFTAGGAADFHRMLKLLDQCAEFTHRLHHAVEEKIFERALRLAPELEKHIEKARSQHETLYGEGAAIIYLIESLLADMPVSKTDLIERLDDFIALNDLHRKLEEDHIFPVIKQRLAEGDWKFIAEFRKALIDRRILELARLLDSYHHALRS